ncbi:hypothetical protein HanRHA438_Chr05g0214671 [Helianthus annuus]|uniref:Uncharacterized protein n=1 Tax=Helianthus annuus TaxID=4232 RepID=A0A9K3IYG9_HELAN|nr:hypothetical protein HanXRQr2_Chr05g0205001 [Helianthus annuus]KAJ0918175.1 hypothetical protein HanRHA438_Chr05g0214671 [Helianthus annuus]KAJ0921952.1 hypothetical protein HanPSC8_Chr05g0197771 [Helianthus annuus]
MDGWNNIVQHIGVRIECVVVLRYQIDYNFQLTLFDVNGSEVIIPRIGLPVNSDSDLRNATPLVNIVDDVEDDVDINSDLDSEVAALFEPSNSDESVVGSSDSDMSIDDDFDEDDIEDSSGASDDDTKEINLQVYLIYFWCRLDIDFQNNDFFDFLVFNYF